MNKIKVLNKFDRYMTIFWLLGPFIYLIERDPADLWLSIICIVIFSLLGLSMYLKNGYEDRVNFSKELVNSFEISSLENCLDTPFNHSDDQWGCILGRGEGEINFILFGD